MLNNTINHTLNNTSENLTNSGFVTNTLIDVANKSSQFIYTFTGKATQEIQNSGMIVSPITVKLISFFIGGGLIWVATKITNKVMKSILIVLGILIVLSIFYSTFM